MSSLLIRWLTRWKEGEKKFEVKLTNDFRGSIYCRVPKPIIEMLGNPEKIKFEVLRKTIRVIPVGKN